MSRNQLYAVIGILAVAVIAMGGYIWHEQNKPKGVQIRIDQNGLSVKNN